MDGFGTTCDTVDAHAGFPLQSTAQPTVLPEPLIPELY